MTHDQHNAWPAPQWHHGFKQCKCPFQPWTSIHAIVYLIRNGNGWLCLRKERIPEQLCKFKPLKKCLRRDPGKWNLASIEKHLQHSFSFFRYRPLQQFKQQLLQCLPLFSNFISIFHLSTSSTTLLFISSESKSILDCVAFNPVSYIMIFNVFTQNANLSWIPFEYKSQEFLCEKGTRSDPYLVTVFNEHLYCKCVCMDARVHLPWIPT